MKIEIGGGGLILGMLGILFIGLKLTNHIDWEWVWVLAPFWAPVVLWVSFIAGMFLLAAIGGGIHSAYESWRIRRRNRKRYGF